MENKQGKQEKEQKLIKEISVDLHVLCCLSYFNSRKENKMVLRTEYRGEVNNLRKIICDF